MSYGLDNYVNNKVSDPVLFIFFFFFFFFFFFLTVLQLDIKKKEGECGSQKFLFLH